VRLFAAVDPPPVERDRLAAALDRLDRLDRAEPADARLRWVPAERWHVTLAFYGEVPEPKVPDLAERLGRAALRSPPFEVRLTGLGTFPSRAAEARVLWVGLDGDVDRLVRLADRCRAAGRRIGLALDARAYRPHLTLARARGAADLRAHVASGYDGDPWPVGTLRLVHSTLGPRAHHETLAAWPLGRTAHYQA
jgi:RNA 2',3'-cyclic 3'-phosphodiesterase